MSNGLKIYKKKLLNLLQPIECLNIIDWSEKYIDVIPDSPYTGKLNLHRTPFLIEPLRQTAETNTTLSVLNFPVQIGKSLILKLLALYQIINDPAPILFLADTPANSEDFCDTSLVPMIRQNRVFDGLISSATGANMKETKIFSNGSILWNRGASNLRNLQRRSVKLLLADECWLYPQGHIEEAVKRITRFQGEGGKAVLVSQSGDLGGEFDSYFQQTNQQEYKWKCPCCGNHVAYNLDCIKYDNEAYTDKGEIDFNRIKESLKYACPFCDFSTPANKESLKTLNDSSTWIAENENAEYGKIGFHTSAFAFLDAYSLIVEYVNAKLHATDGDFSKLKIFFQKRLAMPWAEQYELIDTSVKEDDSHQYGKMWSKMAYITRNGKYISQDDDNIKQEILNGALPLIFMAVDVQIDHFYYTIRAFSKDPQHDSMLIECGQLYTWADIFAKREEFKIPNSNLGIDSGFRTREIYAITTENRCFAMKGHAQRSFKREVPNTIGRKIYESHAVAAPQQIQVTTNEMTLSGKTKPGVRKAFLLSFSANAAKDWLFFNRQRTQKGRANFNIPSNTPPEYNEQMNAEKRMLEGRYYVWRPRKGNHGNHYLDTETMIYSLCLNLLLSRGNNDLEEYIT